jgi:hypothetical protein
MSHRRLSVSIFALLAPDDLHPSDRTVGQSCHEGENDMTINDATVNDHSTDHADRVALEMTRAALADFRADVRTEIMRQRTNNTWCLPGTRDVLRDLELPPIAMGFDGRATISVSIRTVDGASDHEDAVARVVAALDAACSDTVIEFEVDRVDVYLNEHEVE